MNLTYIRIHNVQKFSMHRNLRLKTFFNASYGYLPLSSPLGSPASLSLTFICL